MAAIELKDNEWKKFSEADYAIIDCYGERCGACVMLAPIFAGVADEMAGISFGKVNVSYYPEIAEKYSIDAIPTLLFFRKGEVVNKVIGSVEKQELLKFISEFLYK